MFDYIEMFYNPKRRHGFNSQLSPVEFKKRYFSRLESVSKTRAHDAGWLLKRIGSTASADDQTIGKWGSWSAFKDLVLDIGFDQELAEDPEGVATRNSAGVF